MLLLLLSLVAGVLTVLAPCTLALLPVIVGGTLAGGTSIRRALTVTISLGISVILFTLLLKASTALINVPQSFWEIFSGVIIILIGLTMVFPALWDNLPFVNRLNRDSSRFMNVGYRKQNMLGDIIIGASLGPVFSSCSPTYFLIVATVLPRSIGSGLIYLFAYAIGLCVTLLIVSVAGQKLLLAFGAASDPRSWVKRGIGILFIIVGIIIALGVEARFELAFANSNFLNVQGLEKGLLNARSGSSALAPGNSYASATSTPSTGLSKAARLAAESLKYSKAPEITQPAGYINTDGKPITFAGNAGKVVLVDFWDYSCINCQREIPYVEAWYQKYKNDGLVVVGVHTPEFAFEQLQSNVEAAVKNLGITYPVVLDNKYGTWNAFQNEYWPQVYLINSDGYIVYSHSGEGDYAQTEAAIQKALKERAANEGADAAVPGGTVSPNATELNELKLGSPETYFGSDRNEYLANGQRGTAGKQTLTVPDASTFKLNQLYLGGTWDFQSQYAEISAGKDSKTLYTFHAKNVYMVATGNPSAVVKVLLDGKPVGSAAGADVSADGIVTISADKLYKLVSLPDYETHTLEIDVESGTFDAYTFTFG